MSTITCANIGIRPQNTARICLLLPMGGAHLPPCRPDRQQLGAYPASIGSEKGDAFRRLLSLSKSLFDKLSNANRGAGFAFEQAARCGAHNLCAACAQIPHLHPVMCFVRCTRHRTKQIDILFAPAGANSTRFFDKLKGDAFRRLLKILCFIQRLRSGRSRHRYAYRPLQTLHRCPRRGMQRSCAPADSSGGWPPPASSASC